MYRKCLKHQKKMLVTLRMNVGMCEKLFLKAQNVYNLLFHFLQLFVGREQIGVKSCQN